MQPPLRRSTIAFATLVSLVPLGLAQSPEPSASDAVRVMMTMNSDGSRTVYKFDDAHHKAVATTTGEDGKTRQRVDYDLDESGKLLGRTIAPSMNPSPSPKSRAKRSR